MYTIQPFLIFFYKQNLIQAKVNILGKPTKENFFYGLFVKETQLLTNYCITQAKRLSFFSFEQRLTFSYINIQLLEL